MIKSYEIEDAIEYFIKNNITEFYTENISELLKKEVPNTFNALYKFSEINNYKLNMFYETKCPHCNKRVSEYTDLHSINLGEEAICSSCGEFEKEKSNTYIFFKPTDGWIKHLKEVEGKRLIKSHKKELTKIKNEINIINQLKKVLIDFNTIPDSELSMEGKIIRSQIKTYLNSKK